MSEQARVLFVIANYPPRPGGAERQTQRLCTSLHQRKNRVRILTIRYPESTPQSDSGRAPVWHFPAPSVARLRDACFAIWTMGALLLLRPCYQEVQWVMTGLQVILGLPFAAALGMKNIVMLCGCGDVEQLRNTRRGRWMLGLMKRYADRVIFLNSAMEKELEQLGFERGRLIWLGSVADPDSFRPPKDDEKRSLRRRWGIENQATVITFAGRLAQGKGLPTLVEAFSILRNQQPSTVLLIAGDGPLANELAAKIAEKNLGGRAKLTGQLSETDLSEVLRISDIFVLPSESEGMPVAIVEAMATGLPCVVSDIPGTETVMAGVHGLRVPPEDSAALSDALNRLVSDREAQKRMGRAAHELFLSSFTLEKVARAHERMYHEVLQREPAKSGPR